MKSGLIKPGALDAEEKVARETHWIPLTLVFRSHFVFPCLVVPLPFLQGKGWFCLTAKELLFSQGGRRCWFGLSKQEKMLAIFEGSSGRLFQPDIFMGSKIWLQKLPRVNNIPPKQRLVWWNTQQSPLYPNTHQILVSPAREGVEGSCLEWCHSPGLKSSAPFSRSRDSTAFLLFCCNRDSKEIFLSGLSEKRNEIRYWEIWWAFAEKQQTWFISPKGLPSRGRGKRKVSQHDHQGLAIRDWLIGHSQGDLKGINSMDGEKLFSVVQGDKKRNDRNESQNTGDWGDRAGPEPSWRALLPTVWHYPLGRARNPFSCTVCNWKRHSKVARNTGEGKNTMCPQRITEMA